MRRSGRATPEIQALLREVFGLANGVPLVDAEWISTSAVWPTARVGITALGVYVELIEDNGEVCVLLPSGGAAPLITHLPGRNQDLSPMVVLAFTMGVLLGSRQ